MKKNVKYGIVIVAAVFIVLFSLDIQKLDKHNAMDIPGNFNAAAYARDVWNNKMPTVVGSAPDLISLMQLLGSNPEEAFENFGIKLGISNTYYFIAKGEGTVKQLNEENLVLDVENGMQIQLAVDFIFGNAVRDGSGTVDIDDFVNMTDFNMVSIELNNIVKKEIVPQLNELAQPGIKIGFAGTFAINENDVNIRNIRIVPVSVKIINGE
ncbi:MAG: DUF2291 family protein [Prolixibacteraceae bacterium]|nr:DUF2291 family protein [Prolixibacteraceae bacterium]